MFSRVAIVNGGEAAVRLIHAIRELDTHGRVTVIALHGAHDRGALFARLADTTRELTSTAADPYRDVEAVEAALRDCAADAVWAGWGGAATDPAVAELCERLGITCVGPDAKTLRQLADGVKIGRAHV